MQKITIISILLLSELLSSKAQDQRAEAWSIQQGLGFKNFESARRTITGIEIVHMIRKGQLNTQEQSTFKSFYSLAA
jgi:putative transposase